MSTVTFKLPDKDTPGFLRRMRMAVKFSQKLEQDPTANDIDLMVEFLADFVEEPKERNERVEALWDATEAQFKEIMAAIAGMTEDSDENPTPSPGEK